MSLSKVEGHAAAYKELLDKTLAVEAERDKLRSENLVWPRFDNLVTAFGNNFGFGFHGILLLVCIGPAGSSGLYSAAPMPVSGAVCLLAFGDSRLNRPVFWRRQCNAGLMTNKSCGLVVQELAEECKGLEEALQITDEVQASQPQWPELRRDIEASLRAALEDADEAKHQLVCAVLRLFFHCAAMCS
jgi:hypothetical protein